MVIDGGAAAADAAGEKDVPRALRTTRYGAASGTAVAVTAGDAEPLAGSRRAEVFTTFGTTWRGRRTRRRASLEADDDSSDEYDSSNSSSSSFRLLNALDEENMPRLCLLF